MYNETEITLTNEKDKTSNKSGNEHCNSAVCFESNTRINIKQIA